MSNLLHYFDGFLLNGEEGQFGILGDYIGGVWGTLISAITLFVVYLTWRSTRRSARLQSVTTILAEMLKTHHAIAESGEFSFWDRRGTPALFLREFAAIYRLTKKVVPHYDQWSVDTRIDIAYTFAFYGLSVQSGRSLARYGPEKIKNVQDAVARLRLKSGGKYSNMFKGHQTTLSNYLRNLFGMYTLVDKSNLSDVEKADLGKIIRTKLSNYDQALLALNVVSHLGRAWEIEGIVRKYKPFANVPEHFFGFDNRFGIKSRFPTVEFEWEQSDNGRPSYRTIDFWRWHMIIEARSTSKSERNPATHSVSST